MFRAATKGIDTTPYVMHMLGAGKQEADEGEDDDAAEREQAEREEAERLM